MTRLRFGSATDTGRIREINEDSVYTGESVFAVADGMGGHAAGEVASALAVARLGHLVAAGGLDPDRLREGVAAANADILDAADRDPARAAMGTTLAGIGLIEFAGSDHWIVFNVGDSRVYRFADDRLAQLTVDHSEVAELVAAGLIAPEEARGHRNRNVVTRALGLRPAPEPDVWMFPPTPDERFVVCSDGLTGELTDDEIAAVLRAEPEAQLAAARLVELAVAAGGRDNVTVIVVDRAPSPDDIDEDTVPRSGDPS
jgi:protein phosphatase